MNIEHLEIVKSAILDPTSFFNMDFFFVPPENPLLGFEFKGVSCGTASCIAGHTIALIEPDTQTEIVGEDGKTDYDMYLVAALAQKLLGLDDVQAQWLFYGYFRDLEEGESLDCITPERAAAAIDYLISGGDVFPENKWKVLP